MAGEAQRHIKPDRNILVVQREHHVDLQYAQCIAKLLVTFSITISDLHILLCSSFPRRLPVTDSNKYRSITCTPLLTLGAISRT
jgi:hypothetical protein